MSDGDDGGDVKAWVKSAAVRYLGPERTEKAINWGYSTAEWLADQAIELRYRPGKELYKRCKKECHEEARRMLPIHSTFWRHTIGIKKVKDSDWRNPLSDRWRRDPVLYFYLEFLLIAAPIAVIPAGLAFAFAHTVTYHLPPRTRLALRVALTGYLGWHFAIVPAAAFAHDILVDESWHYINSRKWAREIGCRPVIRYRDCVQDPTCRKRLTKRLWWKGKGKDIINAFYACRFHADEWATEDEVRYLGLEEEQKLKMPAEEAMGVAVFLKEMRNMAAKKAEGEGDGEGEHGRHMGRGRRGHK